MAGVPPLKGSAYSFEVALVDQSDTDVFKTNPTLAAGDVTVSKDGGAFANIGTLPTAIGAGAVLTVALTGTEMTADRIVVLFQKAAGSEWQDLLVSIETETRQINDLSTLTAAQVNAEADTALADYDPPTKAEMDAGFAALNDPAASAVASSVWQYSSRTLTQSAATVAATVAGDEITVQRLTSWSISITGMGSLVGRSKLYFTMKTRSSDDDDDSVVQIEESDGLKYIGGDEADDSAKGSLTVDDAAAGNVTIAVDESVTDLAKQSGSWDVKMVTAAGDVSVLTQGDWAIVAVVTHAVE